MKMGESSDWYSNSSFSLNGEEIAESKQQKISLTKTYQGTNESAELEDPNKFVSFFK